MKVLAIHDATGNIERVLVHPSNGPPGSVTPPPGRFATEVEVAGLKDDPVDPKNYERLMETLRNYRVEAKTAAKLVKKSAARDR